MRWFISYLPSDCSSTTNRIFTGDIERLIEVIQGASFKEKAKILGSGFISGTVVFFHQISNKGGLS